jgi:PAS domain S-box-containing protein
MHMLTRRNGKRLREGKTERLLDEGNLPSNGALFETIFEKAALGIVVTNPSGRILQSNPFFQQLLGYSSEEIIGRDSQQFTHADDAATERALFLTAMEDGQEAVHLKKRYLHKDGHPIWADLTATICRDAEGKPDFVISVVKGITEEVGPEEAMRESELRFKTLAEASFEGMVLSERGLIVDLNDQQARMHGYDRSELIGRPV